MAGRENEAGFGVAGGCVAVIGAAFVAAVFAPRDTTVRLLVMAVTVAVLAAVLVDWRACLAVTGFAALVYVGFLADRDGDLLAHGTAWPDALLLAGAALVGRGERWMYHLIKRPAS
jgi:hypothetical protein